MIAIGSETYRQVHGRLKRERGLASNQLCVDCGGPAVEWSFNHDIVDGRDWCWELYQGRWTPYSMLTVHYDPRCVSCHRLYDRGSLA